MLRYRERADLINQWKQRLGTGSFRAAPVPSSLAATIFDTFGTSLFLAISSLLVSAALARLLGPASFGAYELSVATATLLLLIFGFSLSVGVTFVVSRGVANLTVLRPRLLLISLAQGLAVWIVAEMLRRTQLAPVFVPREADVNLSILLASYVFLSSVGQYGRGILIGKNEIVLANRLDAISKTAHVVAIVMLAILAWRYDVVPTWGAALGILVGVAGLAAVTFWVVSRPSGPSMFAASGLRRAFRFSVPSQMANLTQFLNYRFDIFVIGYFVGLSGVGIYVLASVVAESVWLVSRAVAAVLFPYVASTPESDRRLDATVRSVRMSLAVSVVLALLLSLLALPIFRLAFGASFLASHAPLLWLLPGVTIFTIARVLGGYFSGIGRPGVNFIGSGVGLLVTVPLALYLVPRIGVIGASIATSISYGASTVVAIAYFRRASGVPLRALLVFEESDISSFIRWMRELIGRLRNR